MLANILITTLIVGEILTWPKVPIQKEYYPSGVKEADKVYSTDKPSAKYPLLKLDVTAYDTEYNRIEAGIYSVEYSQENNALLIKDAGNTVKAPAFQLIKLNNPVHIPSANVAFIKDKKVFIIYKNENLEVQSFLYLPQAVLDGN